MDEEILQFKTPQVEDAPRATAILQRYAEWCGESAFVNALIWHKYYGHQIAFAGDALYIKLFFEGRHVFLLPFCTDMGAGCERVFRYCRSTGIAPFFLAAEGARFHRFRELYAGDFVFSESRDDFEYIYSREKLAQLSGKKFHSKRNHISAFSKNYNWQFAPIGEENAAEVLEMEKLWVAEHYDGTNPSILAEQESLPLLLKHRAQLGIQGGLIRVDGAVVAFTLGSPISASVFDVHMEKALTAYSTAYTVINQAFAQHVNYAYLNREDDMGLEGLRKAKLSYQPDILLKKYACKYKGVL